MRIEEVMQRQIHTLLPSHTITDALQLLRNHKIRHIPIVDNNKLLGIVTDRDLKEAIPSPLAEMKDTDINLTPLERIMTTDVIVGHPLDFMEDAALLFHTYQIGCLPIISGKRLVGILTKTDLLKKYIEMTGADQPSSQIELRVVHKPGVLFEVAKVFKELNINVLSVLVYPDQQSSDYKVLMVRLKTMNPLRCIELLTESGFEVLGPNAPGTSR